MERMHTDYKQGPNIVKRLKAGRPMNQTEEHFFCENVGQMFLFHNCNCRFISTEVSGCWHLDDIPGSSTKYPNSSYVKYNKNIIDVIGMPRSMSTVYGVESKATLSDYRNGFCACMPYTYIICPKDVIPKEEIPDKIGLIYVDIPNFHVIGYDEIIGLEVILPARKRIDARWLDKNGKFDANKLDKKVDEWYDQMCYRNTIKNVYNRVNLPIYKKVIDEDYVKSKAKKVVSDDLFEYMYK